MYKYMRENLADTYGFLELQDKILEIMVYIDNICRNNNIDYCLMGGTALGAKRHGGFIPWDDDLDIFMTPDNYSKFVESFASQKDKEKYYLQEWGKRKNMVTFSKLRMNNTTYIEDSLKDWNIHHGIYIDIFILHNCPVKKSQQLWQFFWAKYVITKGMANRNYNRRNGIIGLIVKLAAILPENFLITFGLKQVYKYQKKESPYFCHFLGKAVFKNGIYKKEWFIPTEYISFEKVKLKAPVNLHDFLTERFGNYMIPPSLNKIKWEQHASYWNTQTAPDKTLNYSDESKLI